MEDGYSQAIPLRFLTAFPPEAVVSDDWLHTGLRHWPALCVRVCGKDLRMHFQVLGPFVREVLPECPLFLIVVNGMQKQVGKRKIHYKHRGPVLVKNILHAFLNHSPALAGGARGDTETLRVKNSVTRCLRG
jgi:hypothetical protein